MRRRRLIVLVIAVVAVVAAGAFAVIASNRIKGSASQTAAAYFQAWRKGDVSGMARLVYQPPADFVLRHHELTEELHVESIQLTPGTLRSTGEESAEVPFAGVRELTEFGAWPFDGTLRLGVRDRAWKVLWAPETLHPLLKDGGTLELDEIDATAADLLTSEGDKIPNDSYADAYLEELQPEFEQARHGWNLVSRVPGQPARQLLTRRPEANVERTTLSRPVQAAAARALDGTDDSAIVAIRPSTGEILALADRLENNYSAVRDLFPPGSTFKVITAVALLKAGLDPAAQVQCPGTYTIPFHRAFQNDGEVDRGLVSFTDAFAHSCNTTFVEQATTMLGMDELRQAADEWGFGRPIVTGIGGACGGMPDTDDPNMFAADAIGQGQVVATPLCMAAIAAAVQSGVWRSPRLLSKEQVRRIDGEPYEDVQLDEGIVAALQDMMAAVVDYGTASDAGLPEGVSGKTGTAEVPDGESHGWFIGFRDDLAFCVFVRHGGSGRSSAVPVAARFLNGL
ncbi:penicillin-binding transpeptidase domain-containing protein [Nonomuraea jiangxiensis]|uniref:NTF2-like N-terminal transpeptidase domain-containing protein n=1 Tax=Nonomuraea jiangxiensis TaxID=633440 RepID=A0A1G9A7F4_9ACTN|nr:penicillin-binding transpeptidase domain-containing protein [Nonomuraea jiangxiensis]SDK23259.1 NTF2-like N-terminal transpeptidase domain-containing protein [Nonomuraea jiangxiensis]